MYYIRDEMGNSVVNVVKIPSKVNPANMLTNPLPTFKFRDPLNLIGIVSLQAKLSTVETKIG